MVRPVAVKPEEVSGLERGTRFSVRLAAGLSWNERHRVLYSTANKEVTLTMKGGVKITGTLDESPGYFSRGTKAGANVWLRIPGRKTRKRVPAEEIRHLVGFRAPSLADALTAFIVLNANNPSEEQVAEARSVAAQM